MGLRESKRLQKWRTSTFKVLKIGHIEFEIKYLARMTEFYSQVMGLTVTGSDAETAYLSTTIDHHSVILR